MNFISPSIGDLINKRIISGHFPKHLKTAKIYPIYKTGAKEDPLNYRPISILPTISKLFEKRVNSHLMGYLNKFNLIHPCQSGFRHKQSCNTALVKLIEKWMTSIDNGDIVGTIFIDFSKAFDMVVAQSVTCLATDACLTAIPGVASSIPARSHTFVEIDHEIISTVILLPSTDSFKKGCCQLQAKVCARITGYPLVQACPGKSVFR